MRTFVDNAGRSWTVQVQVDSVKRTKSLAGVDLLEVLDGTLLERLIHNPVLLCDVLYALCKPQAEACNISDEEFGRAMAGDAIDLATTALLEELVDFFPLPRRRVLAKALAKLRVLEARAAAAAEAKIDSPELDQLIEAQLQQISEAPLREVSEAHLASPGS